MNTIRFFLTVCVVASGLNLSARQRFFNLTSADVKIDTVLPRFACSFDLGERYTDSVYTVTIRYPEFVDMTQAEAERYRQLSGEPLPALPRPVQRVLLDRKRASLAVDFCPLVYRDNRYQILVSFMLRVEAHAAEPRHSVGTRAANNQRYAPHSVLATGRWAKIRVPASGVYQLTDQLIRRAGFTDLNRVRVYGYGGGLQNERLVPDELTATDDLKEVATCRIDDRRLFYARGPVSWTSNTAARRTRNPYSDYGYYFITQTDDAPATVDSTTFLNSFYPSADDYHTLYEIDGYSWYHGGRNLFHPTPIRSGSSGMYIIPSKAGAGRAKMSVCVSSNTASEVSVSHNGAEKGRLNIEIGQYDRANERTAVFDVQHLSAADTVRLTAVSGGDVRLDYISFAWETPLPPPMLQSTAFPVPEYVYNITNQDLHADGFTDMVIVIPTSQKLRAQAERLKAFHEQHDAMRVRIVPADELYNEFASGTPDANAYRRYLKMLYDRANSEADMPKYLLLFGDCVWDNRMLTPECKQLEADDYLLCFESENSFSTTRCYVDDGFFCALDDGEGLNDDFDDKQDVAVGRFPVTTDEQAKAMVDKVLAYVVNKNAGPWQNAIVFMGDDGDYNLHMQGIDRTANRISNLYPGYQIKKIMWDAYVRETSSTGNTYPEVERLIKQQQVAGALIMDYGGHGSEKELSHERVLTVADFDAFRHTNLPLWITASCDIMPFDGVVPSIGESAVLNPRGGAIAFFGTTRTVSSYYNELINTAYLKFVLSTDAAGKPITIGEAQRLAKNELITTGQDLTENKLQYSLLGDPAIALHQPTLRIVIDSINGISPSAGVPVRFKAGGTAKIQGHIEQAPSFSGTVTVTVKDSRELITGRRNNQNETPRAFTYYDYTKTLYQGSNKVSNGKFELMAVIPRDLNYTDSAGLMILYAVSDDKKLQAHGVDNSFTVGGSEQLQNDSIGPSIYCYLNSPAFVNGGDVNSTPYFVAKITDENGINTAGSSIGHDLQLTIDGDMSKTYTLNDNFTYDFGSYTSGSIYYSLPELPPGPHRLSFRAWDILNNSSTAELAFNVVRSLEPNLFSVSCTNNPATTSTTFIINHDRIGSSVDVEIDVFDLSGRQLWQHRESGIGTDGAYTVEWNLTADGGKRLPTGVYLYRVRLASDGSSKVSKAKKLIVVGNN